MVGDTQCVLHVERIILNSENHDVTAEMGTVSGFPFLFDASLQLAGGEPSYAAFCVKALTHADNLGNL
jgi:hypothetical protein